MVLIDDAKAIVAKLKAEWKTFLLAVGTVVAGAIQAGAELGLQVPDLLNWCPDKVKPFLLFGLGLAMLLFRRYRPTDVEKSTPEETPTVTPGDGNGSNPVS